MLALSSCNGKKAKEVTPVATAPAKTSPVKQLNLPSVPLEVMQRLYEKATYVDYIFYDLPFSLSQDNSASIRSNLELIGNQPLKSLGINCKPIGREFFQIDGNIEYEADLYYSDGCYGYVFYKDGKQVYANMLSEKGMNFYRNIISQAMGARKQNIPNG